MGKMTELHDAIDQFAMRVPVEDRLDDIVHDRRVVRLHDQPRRPRRLAMAAAAVALVAGAGALIASRQITPAEAPSTDAPVPTPVPLGIPQPLFMLPVTRSGDLTNGQIAVVQVTVEGATSRSIVGIRDNNGYRGLFTVAVFSGLIPADRNTSNIAGADARWTPIDLATGSAEILEGDGLSTQVIQQRNAFWLQVDAPSGEATRAMEAATLSDDGTLSFTTADLIVLNTETATTSDLVTTLFRTTDGIYVETATGTSVFAFNTAVSSATPVEVKGHAGWNLTETYPDGTTAVMLSWMETPDRRVLVHGNVPVTELLAVAEDLKIVDYTAWDKSVTTLAEQEATVTATGDTGP